MKIKTIIVSVVALFISVNIVNATKNWGKTGHRAIGEIAEGYLKNKTKREINKLLNGQSLALVSTFADDIKSDRKYSEFYTWHFVNKSFNESYEQCEKHPKGDLVTGIEKCISILKDKNSSKEDKTFYLKMLVHFVGDLHQPMHVGRKKDKGGNTVQVQWFGSGTNLHRVWDSNMLNSYGMTYTELAENADVLSKDQVKYLQKGTLVNWVNETGKLAERVYGTANVGENLRYRYMYDNFELVRSQLQKGGIRLAKVLNDIFS